MLEYSIIVSGSLNVLLLDGHVFRSITDILVDLSLKHINKSWQYLVGVKLDLIMYLFLLIQRLELLIFCMDDLEYMATLWICPALFPFVITPKLSIFECYKNNKTLK